MRTALYNFLFARHHGGKFILRIEDTDRTRYVEGAAENLIRTLHTVGLDYDEGPNRGGPCGPYFQSQRLEIYENYARQLIEQEHAYYCFCTPEQLEKMRQAQQAAGLQPKYDGTCRHLTPEEVDSKLKKGIPRVIRLKMPQEGVTTFTDLIRGEVTVQNEMVDDQILVKSDGYPTYHLANVIDDHLMGISHVIRGEEWLLSVPKHIQLYRSFGWDIPQMAHLPLLLSPDRSKLSKRHGDVAVEDFLEKGYLPEALINYVALLGWNPGTDQEIFSMDELIKEFSIDRVNKSGAIFDIQKLNWMNAHYIKALPEDKRNQFLGKYLDQAGCRIEDEKKKRLIISAVYKSISYGKEIAEKAALFFQDTIRISEDEALAVLRKPSARMVLETFLTKTASLSELTLDGFKQVMAKVKNETGLNKQDLWMPIRVALTGVTHGPDLPIVIEVLGLAKIRNFVQQALKQIQS
ncbi:MAG: glutamate--tRNA ligase [Calditrichia bacterium]